MYPSWSILPQPTVVIKSKEGHMLGYVSSVYEVAYVHNYAKGIVSILSHSCEQKYLRER